MNYVKSFFDYIFWKYKQRKQKKEDIIQAKLNVKDVKSATKFQTMLVYGRPANGISRGINSGCDSTNIGTPAGLFVINDMNNDGQPDYPVVHDHNPDFDFGGGSFGGSGAGGSYNDDSSPSYSPDNSNYDSGSSYSDSGSSSSFD
jgi:uncharacterized membrane protein YgcG